MHFKSITAQDLVLRSLELAGKSYDGVLLVETAEPAELNGSWWHFSGGKIIDMCDPQGPPILDAALSSSPNLRDRDRKRLQKLASQSNTPLAWQILSQGLLSPDEVSARVIAECELRFAKLLAAQPLAAVLVPEPPATSGDHLSAYLQVSLSVEETLLGAARMLGDWTRIASELPALKDVYYATPEGFQYMQDPEQFPLECALLAQLDGERDLREAIAAAGGEPFACYTALLRLLQEGSVALINPVQMFQLGSEYQRRGDLARALRRYERAQDRGLDDFDLGFKLGEVYSALGRREEGIEQLLQFGDKCASQFRIEDTIRAYRMIVEIDSTNLSIQDRYLSLLTKYGRSAEVVEHGLALARRLADHGEFQRARNTLDRILPQSNGNEEILKYYLELCRRSNDEEGATRMRRTLGELYHHRQETARALELYQNLYVQGDNSVDTRSCLVELHYRAGHLEQAREHLHALRSREGWSPRRAAPEALEFFRRLEALAGSETAVSGWLLEEARARSDRDETIRLLKVHRQNLEAAGNVADARRTAEQLLQLQPNDLEAARQLARLEQAAGNARAATSVLERAAQHLAETGATPEQQRALLQELVESDPHTLLGRRLLIALATPEQPVAPRIHIETALLELLAGNYEEALRRGGEAPLGAVSCTHLLMLTSQLAQSRGEQARAVESLHRCAKVAAGAQDRVLLAESIRLLQQLTPNDAQLEEYRRALTTLAEPGTPDSSAPAEPVVKSSVSGITARLRNLKSSADSQSPSAVPTAAMARAAGSQNTVSQTALGSVARLKAMKSGGGAAADVAPPPAPKSAAAVATTATAESGGAGGAGGNTMPAASMGAGDFAPLPKPTNKPMGKAASKLSSLRKN